MFCIIPYFNFFGEQDTINNHIASIAHLRSSQANYMTIEARLYGKTYLPMTSNSVSFNTESILWHKERLINLGIKLVQNDYDSIAWIDSGILFEEPDWIDRVRTALETYDIVQLPATIKFLDQDGNVSYIENSFARNMELGLDGGWHGGYAWAARSSVLKRAGLYDHWVVGSGDALMLRGFYNQDKFNFAPDHISYPYLDEDVNKWRTMLGRVSTGHANLTAIHLWHGPFENRFYLCRDKMLADLKYTYETCIRQDELMLEWTYHAEEVRQAVEAYFDRRFSYVA